MVMDDWIDGGRAQECDWNKDRDCIFISNALII